MKALRKILNSKGMIKTHAPDFLLLSSPSQLFHLHPGSFSISSLGRGETSLTRFWVLSTYKWQAAKLEMESLNSAFNRSEEISGVGNSFYFSTKTGFQDDHFSRKQNLGLEDSFVSSVSPVTQSSPTLCDPVDCSTPGFPVHHQLPELAQTSCSPSQWCHPTIFSSVAPLSSCLQSFPPWESFPMSQFYLWGINEILIRKLFFPQSHLRPPAACCLRCVTV